MSSSQQKRALAGWEHWQIDLQIDPGLQGVTQLHAFDRLGLTLSGQVERGELVELLLAGRAGEEIISEPTPLNMISSGGADPLPLSRSWRVTEEELTVHVHIWVDELGIGFADIFVSGED